MTEIKLSGIIKLRGSLVSSSHYSEAFRGIAKRCYPFMSLWSFAHLFTEKMEQSYALVAAV